MKINKGLTREEFRTRLGIPDQCLKYLSDQNGLGRMLIAQPITYASIRRSET